MYNVGSFFRTCDATGVQKIYLTGHTPAPIDRFGRSVGAISKTALGAERTVAWEHHGDGELLVQNLKHCGVHVVALEQDNRAIDYRAFTVRYPTALIVGSEPDGIPQDMLELCDTIVEIPMQGSKESLNVGVALGVALYHFLPFGPPDSGLV